MEEVDGNGQLPIKKIMVGRDRENVFPGFSALAATYTLAQEH